MPAGSSVEEQEEANKVPEFANVQGVREMTKQDLPQVSALLSNYLKKFQLHPVFTEERLEHMLVPRKGMLYSYVVVSDENKITDFVSFYVLPHTVLNHPTIKEYNVRVGFEG